MKKKILYILVFLTVILTYELINSYSVIDIEISEQEQEEINSFYEINPESISRGNVFDLKYVFCVSEDQEFTKYVGSASSNPTSITNKVKIAKQVLLEISEL